MKVLKSRKSVIAALALSAIALTSCSRVKTAELNNRIYNIEDNSLLKDYNEELTLKDRLLFDSTGLSILKMPGLDGNQLMIEYDNTREASDDVYKYIDNRIAEMTEYDALNIYLSKGNLDFSKVDVSKFKSILFDVADVDFDYKPFYDNTYNFLSLKISAKTNIDSIVDFLENTKTESASIHITFEDNMNIENSQRVIDALAKINSVNTIDITHSNINELNIADLACHTLFLSNLTTSDKINNELTINDTVELLFISTSYPQKYDGESYLESFKIHSNNERLSTNYQIYRVSDSGKLNIKVDDQSVIDVPNNTKLDISGIDISEVSNEWLKRFSNLKSVNISSSVSEDCTFAYDSERNTMDEAVVAKCLKEIGIYYNISDGVIVIDGIQSSSGKVPEEFYTILNEYTADRKSNYFLDKDHLFLFNLDDQIDFSKVDLSNISSVDFNSTGSNFDFTPFYDQNITDLNLTISKDADHEKIIAFLNNNSKSNTSIFLNLLDFEENNSIFQQLYIDTICNNKNLQSVKITTDIPNDLNFKNLMTRNLAIYTENNNDIINYDISLNDKVQHLYIYTYYEKDFPEKVYIGDINIASNNNLYTSLHFFSYDFNNYFNVFTDSNITNIKVPDNSFLNLESVDFDSIDDDVINKLDYLEYLCISEDGNEDCVFKFYEEDVPIDEALKEFKAQNKNRRGPSLTLNKYFK